MRPIRDILPGATRDLPADRKTSRKTERGELMRYFRAHLNVSRHQDHLPLISMPRMGKILEGIRTADLYYLKSVCDKAANFGKKFWWEIDPKKHIDENKKRPS